MIFETNKQLAQILVANGLLETTEKVYPKFFQYISNDPELYGSPVKRQYNYGPGLYKKYIVFDRININANVNNCLLLFGTRLSEVQLRSILTWIKISAETRRNLRVKTDEDILRNYEYSLRDNLWLGSKKALLEIKTTFEQVDV